jgi:hypothetical protein
MILMAVAGSASGYENPTYVTGPIRSDGSFDTLGTATFLTEPAYLQNTVLDIEWFNLLPQSDSVGIYLRQGQVCSFDWDKLSHTWYGDFDNTDTLRCSFAFKPLQVGTLAVKFVVTTGEPFWWTIPIDMTFDEIGSLVPSATRSGTYGTLGPAPEIMSDELFFFGPCHEEFRKDRDEMFGIKARLTPPLAPGVYSDIEWTIVPSSEHRNGVCYLLSYDDIFDVVLEEDADWPHHVNSGDVLTVRARVMPLKPGVGTLDLRVYGFTPHKEPSFEYGTDDGGRTNDALRLELVVGEDLRLLAHGQKIPIASNPIGEKLHDSHRLQAIDAVRGERNTKTIFSENYSTMKQ